MQNKYDMTTYLKKISTVILAIMMLVACSQDKNKKLIKLKKEQQALIEEIAQLEKEIATDGKDTAKMDDGVLVKTVVVAPRQFSHSIEIQGALDGEENVKVYPEGQGMVTQVLVKMGSKVSKGQIMARLDDKALRKSMKQTETQYKLACDLYDRQKNLWEQKIGSEVQFLQAKTQKEALESGLAAIKEQLGYLTIKSPISGTIEDLPLKVGMAASPAMPVATVINFSSNKIVADVAEAYNKSISAGDSVAIWFPDLKTEIKSTITTASKYINPTNRSFKVEVRLPSKLANLKANMIAVLRIIDYKNKSAIVVPVNLVQNDAKGSYLYVLNNGGKIKTAHKRYITPGMTYNGIMEIISGLNAGDAIVIVGQLGLSEGAKVKE
jgi:RND family efflux transporter, MFP subunit